MEPILFIHGFSGGRFHYLPIENYLKKKGIRKIYEFNYKNKFWQVSLREIAKELDKFIDNNVKEKQISIVAISQGGLIAHHYVQNHKNNVKKCISVCTPYKGVWWATIFSFLNQGLKDLSIKSNFIKEINANMKKESRKVKLYSIWTPFDIIVFPGVSAKLKGSKSKRVLAIEHHLAFWSPKTKKAVFRFLTG